MASTLPPLIREEGSKSLRNGTVWALVAIGCAAVGVLVLWSFFFPRLKGSLTTREPSPPDFSSSNAVSLLLGEEGVQDGLIHLADEGDGRTEVEDLEGVPCRHLNRMPENHQFGYVYFAIHPSFKGKELKNARIDVDYLVRTPSFIRLQYNGRDGEKPKPYKATVAQNGDRVNFGSGAVFSRIRESSTWQTATFHVTNALFMNAQNGGADFRLEVTPAEIYLRRVTVTREGAEPVQPTAR
jgi:hypothetical protein